MTNVTQPHIVGSGLVAGAQVLLYEGSTRLGGGVADGQGNYAIQPDSPLADGVHSLSVRQVVAGVASDASASRDIGIDTTPMDLSSLSWVVPPSPQINAAVALEFPDPLGSILSLTVSAGSQPTQVQIDPTDPRRLDFHWQTPGSGSVNLAGTVTDIAGNASSFVKPVSF
ncbi:MAG TPA: hypothetical protein HPQ04_07070 [Rhodospirillaceae bacterium]|nr:hypothetical protein [Rhodospirillaceae bacterium]